MPKKSGVLSSPSAFLIANANASCLKSANALPLSVYRRYICQKLPFSRPTHIATHNLVLHKDDPWWNINTPPNDWNCQCELLAIGKGEAERRGLTIIENSAGLPDIAGKDWRYNPADPKQGFDNNSAPPIERQPDYKSVGRPDLREVTEYRNPAPELLEPGETKEEAVAIISKALLGDKDELLVKTPVGKELIVRSKLPHMVDKPLDQRERFANYVLPTLQNPYEVYVTQHADGSRRRRYIGLFEGGKSFLAVTMLRDGNILWNIIPSKDGRANKFRKGWLIYGQGYDGK
ncbi:MAG: hypothetical protein LBI57_08045 [Helicobacteraceae bacterium]|nr:hypothetical protein [Helicobacteraceae bacterium]